MLMPKSDKQRHSQRFLSDLRFAKNWLSKPRSTGSITPTGKSAARLMASFVSPDTGQPVLELGPGTGSVTREILATGLSPDQLTCVEYNGDFCKHLSRLYPDSNIVEGDAFNLDETLGPNFKGRFSVILSCLPLLNFPRAARAGYIENALGFVREGGAIVQLCYGPKPPVEFADGRITCKPTKWILANIPPARFWVYRRAER